jgi:hypothetical protein
MNSFGVARLEAAAGERERLPFPPERQTGAATRATTDPLGLPRLGLHGPSSSLDHASDRTNDA